jgi:signal transduction histidine kinase
MIGSWTLMDSRQALPASCIGDAIRLAIASGSPRELARRGIICVQLQQVMLNLIVNAIQSMSGVEDGNRG